jgi:general stress protein 26
MRRHAHCGGLAEERPMSQMTLPDVSKKMRDIDFMMLMTKTEGGEIAGRPMSNNRDVDYDGDSYFFALEESRTFEDVKRDPKVTLSAQTSKGLLGKPPLFLTIEGEAEIIRDKQVFTDHWTHDMDRWAEQGPDTPGLIMLKVHAQRIHYWDGEDQGELRV